MIAAVYVRKSTEDTRSREEGKSTERQIANATAYAAEQGWTVDPELVFIDDGISGAEFANRPGLAACREAAAAHRFEKLVVMERSRLGRDVVLTLYLIRELEEADVETHAYGDSRGPIRSGDLITLVGAYSDMDEKKKAGIRVREALTAKARRGHATGPAPYGYTTVRRGEFSVYQIDPDEAAVVVQAFRWSAEGLGDDRIRNRLGEQTGTSWRKNSVRRMLANPVYIGSLVYGRTATVPKGGKAKRRERRAEPAVVLDKPELRIVEQGLWDQVAARKVATRAHYSKGDTAAKPAAGTVSKHLLTGIARCSECGHTMAMIGSHRLRYYCLGRQHRGVAFCSNKSGVPMELLDQAVIGTLLDEMLSDTERLYTIIREREAARAVPAGPVVNVAREVAKLELEITRLINLAASGSKDVLAGITERRGRIELLKAKPVVEPITKAAVVTGYAALRMKINRKNPGEVRALLARVGCTRIMITKTGPLTWDFEGAFDAGRVLNIAPPSPA